jgi:imidazolonepropionase-like amidohydrolase
MAIVGRVTGGEARAQIVIVEDGVIHAAGRGLPIPDGARVADLSTEWLVRNLIDAHTQLTLAQFGGDAPGEAVYASITSAVGSPRDSRRTSPRCLPIRSTISSTSGGLISW